MKTKIKKTACARRNAGRFQKTKKTPVRRDEHGHWLPGQSGNPAGSAAYPAVSVLWDAIRRVQEKKNKNLLHSIIEKAYTDARIAIAILDRIWPKLSAHAIVGGPVLPNENVETIRAQLLAELKVLREGEK